MTEARTTSYDEGGYDIIHHEIIVDGTIAWSDWICDDGTDYFTGKDVTADVNTAYEQHGLPPPYKPIKEPES